MFTSEVVRWKNRDRLVQGRTSVSRGELPAQREQTKMSDKSGWILDRGKGKSLLTVPSKHSIFIQGEVADAVFYIKVGTVKLTVASPEGKEAVIAILARGAFVGESCLGGQLVRTATAIALEETTLVRFDKDAMVRVLQEEPVFVENFVSFLLVHTMRVQQNVVDQLFNCSEKRLARLLMSLAHLESAGKTESVIPRRSQELFAEMIGTTRSRVSFFMNKFRKLGYIDYHGSNGEVHVRSSLLKILLRD